MIIKSTKKLLHINGDHYNEKKTTMKIYKQLKLEIKKRYYLEEIFIDDSYLNFINNCIGCKTCFKTGNCIYDNKDGIIEIKNKLLGADIIVISTPIFIDNISGNLKTLFDRLSYWFHTMPLKGKKCILIISTYRTGINEVSNYLYKICSYLGLEVVGLITSDYKTTKNVLCNEIDISLDYLETGLLKKCTNVAYSDYIYNLYDKDDY